MLLTFLPVLNVLWNGIKSEESLAEPRHLLVKIPAMDTGNADEDDKQVVDSVHGDGWLLTKARNRTCAKYVFLCNYKLSSCHVSYYQDM